jgi:hypothetical protein
VQSGVDFIAKISAAKYGLGTLELRNFITVSYLLKGVKFVCRELKLGKKLVLFVSVPRQTRHLL